MAIRDEILLFFDGACGRTCSGWRSPCPPGRGGTGATNSSTFPRPGSSGNGTPPSSPRGRRARDEHLRRQTRSSRGVRTGRPRRGDQPGGGRNRPRGDPPARRTRVRGRLHRATTKLPSLDTSPSSRWRKPSPGKTTALVEAGRPADPRDVPDLLQIKIALVSCFGRSSGMEAGRPRDVSITIENTGTMLVGPTSPPPCRDRAVPRLLDRAELRHRPRGDDLPSPVPLPPLSRPRLLHPQRRNPAVRDGKTHYPLSPEAFAAQLSAFVRDDGSDRRRCCGTTPGAHPELREALEGVAPARRNVVEKPSISSLYQAAEIRQRSAVPPSGSVQRERLEAVPGPAPADDLTRGRLRIALEQQEDGAHAVDLCTAYAGRTRRRTSPRWSGSSRSSVQIPMVIDSTTPDCIEAALKNPPREVPRPTR